MPSGTPSFVFKYNMEILPSLLPGCEKERGCVQAADATGLGVVKEPSAVIPCKNKKTRKKRIKLELVFTGSGLGRNQPQGRERPVCLHHR